MSTIDRSSVYDNKVTTTKNAQFDRRNCHIEKRDSERNQTDYMNCESLESLDYTLSNIRQVSLPEVGASFRDIFDEKNQYPRR